MPFRQTRAKTIIHPLPVRLVCLFCALSGISCFLSTDEPGYDIVFPSEWSNNFVHYPLMEFTSETEPAVDAPDDADALFFFHLFWTDQLLDLLVQNSNSYADGVEARLEKPGRTCCPISKREMKAFLGLSILMGVLRFPRLEDYWQTSCHYMKTNLSTVFSETRYKQISKCEIENCILYHQV